MARKRRSYSQRYEYEPLPERMKLEELSDDFRRELWDAMWIMFRGMTKVNSYGTSHLPNELVRSFVRTLGNIRRTPRDRINTDYDEILRACRNVVLEYKFNWVLDLIEALLEGRPKRTNIHIVMFVNTIEEAFREQTAYKLVQVDGEFQFFPQSSEEQGKAAGQAIQTLYDTGMEGAAAHLREAAKAINKGDKKSLAQAVADSIHAVESVARMIDPKASKDLGPALTSLTDAGVIKHPALKNAFAKLYGYTSDEQGIRHALLDKGAPDVDIDEAVFMFGACASFAAYLVNKYQKMNPA